MTTILTRTEQRSRMRLLYVKKQRRFVFERVEGTPKLFQNDGKLSVYFDNIREECGNLIFSVNGHKVLTDKRKLLYKNDGAIRSRMSYNGFRLETDNEFQAIFEEKCEGVIVGYLKDNQISVTPESFFYAVEINPLPTAGTNFQKGNIETPAEWQRVLEKLFQIKNCA